MSNLGKRFVPEPCLKLANDHPANLFDSQAMIMKMALLVLCVSISEKVQQPKKLKKDLSASKQIKKIKKIT